MPRRSPNLFARWLRFIPDYWERKSVQRDYPLDIWKPKKGGKV